MTYYHGRSKSRPYYGNSIYLTDSINYASLYSDSNFVYQIEIICPENLIFSLKNENDRKRLLKLFPNISKIDKTEEIDWAEMGSFCSESFDDLESALVFLGYKGVRIKERTSIESVLIFNQENVQIIGKVYF